MFGGSFRSVYSPRSEHVIASPKGGRLHVSPSMFKEDASSAQLLLDPATCHHCRTLRYDTNVLVLQRLNELSTISVVNLALAIACVMYLGSTVVLLIFTMVPGTTSDSQIHRLEFGGTFIFTLVTTLALIFSPERKFHSPLLLKVLVLVNVCSSFVAFLLVYISLSSFERLAHEIEYANELCTAVVDVLIILTLELKGDAALQRRQRSKLAILGLLAVCVPVLQLTVYNSAWGGEIRARYVEFCFNSTSAAVSFWFARIQCSPPIDSRWKLCLHRPIWPSSSMPRVVAPSTIMASPIHTCRLVQSHAQQRVQRRRVMAAPIAPTAKRLAQSRSRLRQSSWSPALGSARESCPCRRTLPCPPAQTRPACHASEHACQPHTIFIHVVRAVTDTVPSKSTRRTSRNAKIFVGDGVSVAFLLLVPLLLAVCTSRCLLQLDFYYLASDHTPTMTSTYDAGVRARGTRPPPVRFRS